MQTDHRRLQAADEHYVTTASGRRVSLLDPRAEDIQIRDIAAALARICWAAGAVHGGFYSGAQHAVEVLRECPQSIEAMYGLLHNARSAYLGKIPAPLMLTVGDGLFGDGEIERRFDAVILEAMGLPRPTAAQAELVARKVRVVEATIARDLLGGLPTRNGADAPRPGRLVPMVSRAPGKPSTAFWDKAEESYLREFWAHVTFLHLPIRRNMVR